jgi:hypothetical protein
MKIGFTVLELYIYIYLFIHTEGWAERDLNRKSAGIQKHLEESFTFRNRRRKGGTN